MFAHPYPPISLPPRLLSRGGLAVLLALIALLLPLPSAPVPQPAADPANLLKLAQLPLSFEPNAGQADAAARYLAHTPGGTLFFTPGEVVLALSRPPAARTNAAPGAPPETRSPRDA